MARTITNPGEGSDIDSSVIRTELQTLETEIADTTSGHDHDGTDSKKIPNISSSHFASLSGANLTGIPETAISDGSVLARVGGNETITGLYDFTNASGLKTDNIVESTSATGVTIDSVLLKDGGVTLSGNLALAGNSITGTSVDINNAELQQLSNIGATTISATQWGYLGAMSAQPVESLSDLSLESNLADLTSDEISQLENIGATTISATQWGYLGAMSAQPAESLSDLGLNSNLADLTSDEITQLKNIGATTISAAQWGYLGSLDQSLATDQSPTFAGGTITDDIKLTSGKGIYTNTSDGSDSGTMTIAGGGARSDSRGPYIWLYGNEFATDAQKGELRLVAGLGDNSSNKGDITFWTNGSERMRIDSSGNVGIGEAPSQKFQVKGSTNNRLIYFSDVADQSTILLTGNIDATATSKAAIEVQRDGVSGYKGNLIFKTCDGATDKTSDETTEAMRIDSSGIVTISGQSRARAYRTTSNQAISDTTMTKIQLNAEDYDENGEFDSTTNYRFTATVAGYYLVVGQVGFGNIADQGRYSTRIFKNGSQVSVNNVTASGTKEVEALTSDIVYLAASDYIELKAYIDAGGASAALASDQATYLSIHKIS